MVSPDHLRTKFQESSALFLAVASSFGKVGGDEIDHTPRKKRCLTNSSTSNHTFDPNATANSLILRSVYATAITGDDSSSAENLSKCIISSVACRTETTETVNLIRSGGKVKSVPADTADNLTFKSVDYHENKANTSIGTGTSTFKSTSRNILQLAESVAEEMISASSCAEVDKDRNTIRHDFFCKCCGGLLFPCTINEGMPSTIRVRPLKRSRTRRRRASRYAAKQKVFDEFILQKHRGGGRTFAAGGRDSSSHGHGSSVMEVMDTKVALKAGSAARRVKDGTSKNCVRFRCGGCGQEQVLKGLKHRRETMLGETSTSAGSGSTNLQKTSVGKRHAVDSNERHTPKRNKSTIGMSGNIGSEDFVSLQSFGQSAPTAAQTKLKPLQQYQQQGKKQRKPKPKKPVKRSGLQDFLSSLND